ncbi:MAG TPA: GNAT family protein [Actinomycetota bacterium]|nr:GNAT family protein [Actinomycetota bacterium]
MASPPRVEIEPIDSRHGDDLLDAIASSLLELRRWMPWAIDWDPEESKRYFATRDDNDPGFAIIHDGAAVGGIGIIRRPLMGWGEIGYWLRTDLVGRGIVSVAVAQSLAWAFGPGGLHRIELRAGRANAASNRVAEKLGFTLRGWTRESARGEDGYYDCNLWELVEDEWEGKGAPTA